MTREPSRPVVGWLLLAIVALIAYGSLYPFNIRAETFDGGLLRALNLLSWQRAGRADRVSNVLLYLPLGFLLFLALVGRLNRFVALALATLLGALLSLIIEVTQVYISVRVPSLTDLTLNTLGSALGAFGGVGWRALSSLIHIPGRAEKPARDPTAALIVVLWLAWRFAPFAPQLDLGKLKSALEPLIRPTFEPVAVFMYLACWLVVNQAIAALVSRQHRLEGLLIVIAAVLVGRLVVANQAFVPSELLALLLLLPLLVLMHRIKPWPRRAVLVFMVVAVLVLESLGPFDFSTRAPHFDLWPFKSWLASGAAHALLSIDWVEVFGGLFLFAALAWVLREAGATPRAAVAVMMVVAIVLEVLQAWLPQEHASITQPLLAAVLAWALLNLESRRRARGRLAISPAARSR